MSEPDDYDPINYDDDDEPEETDFQCAAFLVDGKWYCPIAGTEDCDWDCPDHRGR